MKGEKAEYTISLEKAFMFPGTKRLKKALAQIRKFVHKHARPKKVAISNEVSEFIHKQSRNIPRKLKVVLYKEATRVVVFLQNSKEFDSYIKKKAEARKKEAKGKEKEEKKSAEEKKEEAKAEEEQKKLLEEKRMKEEAGKAIEIKRS